MRSGLLHHVMRWNLDYSALVVLERTPPQRLEEPMRTPVTIPPSYAVLYAKRWSLHTPFRTVIHDTAIRLQRAPIYGEARVLFDRTGIGLGVFEMAKAARLRPIPIFSHGGHDVSPGKLGGFGVPKRDLCAVIHRCLEEERLRFARKMLLMDVLFHELQNFHYTLNPLTAHDSYAAWREKDHDDLVFALAMSVWYGETIGSKQAGGVALRY